MLISFVIPFYNVEKYIGQCLESIYAQNLAEEDFEVICIDDCSPDNSVQIVSRYQEDYANLRLITHENNKGLGAARNTGLRAAVGKYVWFVDSDDQLAPTVALEFLKICTGHRLDILAFNYSRLTSDNNIVQVGKTFSRETNVESGIDLIRRCYGESYVYYLLGYVYIYIYRKDYLIDNNFIFPEGVYWEDTVFCIKALMAAQSVQFLPTIGYYYRVNDNSISRVGNGQMPAKQMYDMSFVMGVRLMEFALKIEDVDLCNAGVNCAKSMINRISLNLLRTNKREANYLYEMLKVNRAQVERTKPYLNLFSRFVVSKVGRICLPLLTFLYRCKQRLKSVNYC